MGSGGKPEMLPEQVRTWNIWLVKISKAVFYKVVRQFNLFGGGEGGTWNVFDLKCFVVTWGGGGGGKNDFDILEGILKKWELSNFHPSTHLINNERSLIEMDEKL